MVDEKPTPKLSGPQQDIVRNFIGSMQLTMNRPMFSGGITYANSLRASSAIRDISLHRYSILPGAINTYINIATSREWTILGSPRRVSRIVDRVNDTYFMDEQGIKHRSWEDIMSRMCMDFLTIGRNMLASKLDVESGEWDPLEYIDSATTLPATSRKRSTETIWQYSHNLEHGPRDIPQSNLFFMDCFRIGKTGIPIGLIPYLIPVAHLDWLLREHDSMQLDGRKMRDILFVDEGMQDTIREGMLAAMALASGEDPSKHGLPIVAVSRSGAERPIEEYFARLGLSEIPREFTRSEFESRYAREISATLGIPLGQFWNDPRGTNRSLEQVTQERAQLKGPAYFVRSVERMINNSKWMGNTPKTKCIIQFEEETDSDALRNQSMSFKTFIEGIEKLQVVMMNSGGGEQFDADRWISFLEKKMLFPPNVTLADVVAREEMTLKRNADETMQKGWVRMNASGIVVERRPDYISPVTNVIQPQIEDDEPEGIEGYFCLSFNNNPELITWVNEQVKTNFNLSDAEWVSPETYHCTLVHGTFSWDQIGMLMRLNMRLPLDAGAIIAGIGSFAGEQRVNIHANIILGHPYVDLQHNLYNICMMCCGGDLGLSEYSKPENYKSHITLGYGHSVYNTEDYPQLEVLIKPHGFVFNIEIGEDEYEVLSAYGENYRVADLEKLKEIYGNKIS